MKHLWLLAYACGIGLALMGWSVAPVVLAIGVPGVFLLLPRLREEKAVAGWVLMLVAGTLGFWRLSGGGTQFDVDRLIFLAIIAGVPFFQWAIRNRSLGIPLTVVAVLAVLVGFFSSAKGGADPMQHWLVLHGYNEAQAHEITLIFRKTVHFTFYGTVGLTSTVLGWRATGKESDAVRTGLFAALFLAAFDELRQSAYTNRSGSAWDVLLDLAGAATFIGLSRWIVRRKR